jgi:hypothetical protein
MVATPRGGGGRGTDCPRRGVPCALPEELEPHGRDRHRLGAVHESPTGVDRTGALPRPPELGDLS